MQRLKSFFQNMRIGTKLSAGVIAIVLLLTTISMSLFIRTYRDHLIDGSLKIMTQEVFRLSDSTASDIVSIGKMATATSNAQESGLFWNREAGIKQLKKNVQDFPSIFGQAIAYQPDADGKDTIYAGDTTHSTDGRFLPFYYWNDGVERDTMIAGKCLHPESEWYQGPMKKAEKLLSRGKNADFVYYTEPYLTRDIPTISVVRPIILNDVFKGVISTDISLLSTQKRLQAAKPYTSARSFLISAKGTILAGDFFGEKKIGSLVTKDPAYREDFAPLLKGDQDTVFERTEADGRVRFVVYRHLKDINMILGMAVDKSELLQPINDITKILLLVGGLIVLLSIAFVLELSKRVIVKPIGSIMSLFSDIGMGNFESRAEVSSQDEIGEMAESLNAMLDNTLNLIQSREERDAMEVSIMKLLGEISGLTDGDMTVRAEVTDDMTGAIADSFNLMAEQLGDVVQNVKNTAALVASTSEEVHISTVKLAEGSVEQATEIASAVDNINEMSRSIYGVSEKAVTSSEVSNESTKSAQEGAMAVQKTNESMTEIRENVQETARAIKRLGESSQEIDNIVQIIGDIADRTSILALNASIQAAMAGDAGRGFAVVAEEVQRLSEQSTESTKQIDTLIKNIQGEITEAAVSMDASIQRVVEGSRLAEDAHAKLEEIQHISTNLAEMIDTISTSTKEQAQTSERISRTMERVGEISVRTSTTSQETASRMDQLEETAGAMMESITSFKVA